jgi:pilus assembly protein Flp/PilA
MNKSTFAALKSSIQNLHNDENGQDLVEYALVTAIVSLGTVTALQSLATYVGAAFNDVATQLSTAIA